MMMMLMLRHQQWVLKRLAVSVLVVTVVLLAFYSSSSSSSSRTASSSSAAVSYRRDNVLQSASRLGNSDDAGEIMIIQHPSTTTLMPPPPSSDKPRRRRRFAVFSCATPENIQLANQREYDYAFYLPLTVLAWRRIGFESLVLIVGHRSEWQSHPVLAHVLDALQKLSGPDGGGATVLFLPAKKENRVMLSQTARIFTANLDGYPGRPSDFILTSDSDLWPLRRQHFYQPEGEDADAERPLMLFHSDCCRPFVFKGRSYKMQPMSHVGASAAIWREMVNDAGNSSSSATLLAKDAPSILDRLAKTFGQQVRHRVKYASGDWFLDQKFITLSIHRWLFKGQRQQSQQQTSPIASNQVYKVSDVGLRRLDRLTWNANINKMTASVLDKWYYDAHLPLGGFQPAKWNSIRPLLRLMYNGNASSSSSQTYRFCDNYATTFRQLFIKNNTTEQS